LKREIVDWSPASHVSLRHIQVEARIVIDASMHRHSIMGCSIAPVENVSGFALGDPPARDYSTSSINGTINARAQCLVYLLCCTASACLRMVTHIITSLLHVRRLNHFFPRSCTIQPLLLLRSRSKNSPLAHVFDYPLEDIDVTVQVSINTQ
jgi:hypothetical protein